VGALTRAVNWGAVGIGVAVGGNTKTGFDLVNDDVENPKYHTIIINYHIIIIFF
jgi:hypothetical protein